MPTSSLSTSKALHIYRTLVLPSISVICLHLLSHDPRVSDNTEQLLQGPVTKLSFQLKPNTHLNTFIPTETNEPLVPKGAKSGTVLDAVRSLSNATVFSGYIRTTDLPESMLDRIISIVNNQLLTPNLRRISSALYFQACKGNPSPSIMRDSHLPYMRPPIRPYLTTSPHPTCHPNDVVYRKVLMLVQISSP